VTLPKRLKRKPWAQFYYQDFCNDPRVKLCSRAARSFWLDCLRIMHEATPHGFLAIEGVYLSETQLAVQTSDSQRDVHKYLAELRAAGVPSIVGEEMPDDVRRLIPPGAPNGAIFSRRMLRDQHKSAVNSENGKKGGDNSLGASRLSETPSDRLSEPLKRNSRGRPSPRDQRPDTRIPPISPQGSGQAPPAGAAVRKPPPRADGWDELEPDAIKSLGKTWCDTWLFPCRIVPLAPDEVALEAPSALFKSRCVIESQRLHDLFGKAVKFTLAEGAAT
jgi:hypothetical protein